jgi:hypothetical protein
MSVALTEAAMIALDGRLDDAHRIVGGPLETILAKADRQCLLRQWSVPL